MSATKWLGTALLYGIGGLSLVFVLELGWFTFGGSDGSVEQATLVDIGKTETLSIRDIGSDQDYQEILDRPLFIWNRKPIAIDATEANVQTSGDLEARWELSGIIANDTTYYAYLNPLAGGVVTRLEQGMIFEKWKVKLIEPEQVVLISVENGSVGSGSDGSANDDSGAEQKVLRMKETIKPMPSKRAREILAKRKASERNKGKAIRLEARNGPGGDQSETEKPAVPKR